MYSFASIHVRKAAKNKLFIRIFTDDIKHL